VLDLSFKYKGDAMGKHDKFFESIKTSKGGYNRATLEKYGVSWPPKKGWKKIIISRLEMGDRDSAKEILKDEIGEEGVSYLKSDEILDKIIDSMIKFKSIK